MHEDLRRRALESKKIPSKRQQARSQVSSRVSSKVNSAVNSRAASRDVSDDEDDVNDQTSDGTVDSTNSVDALPESEELDEATMNQLKEVLAKEFETITARKGVNRQQREDTLHTYIKTLTDHYWMEVLDGRHEEILEGLSRIIRNETSSLETVLALKAVELTAISCMDDGIFSAMGSLLKQIVSDSQDRPSKAAAIHCLTACMAFGGAGEESMTEIMTFLLEVISSDGTFIGADDDADVVTAASQSYALLATMVEDVEAESEDAVEAFMEQLNSSKTSVQIAAGQAIALLFEKSYTPREEGETPSDTEEGGESSGSDLDLEGDKNLIKRYSAYHNSKEVLDKVTALAHLSSKGVHRRDRQKLHQSFASISMTVENPRVGLRTHSASKMTVKVHREGEIRVDKWWKLMRLNLLRRVLTTGFINHYFEGNEQLLESLPVIVRNRDGTQLRRASKNRNGDKYRESRKFVSAGFD